MLVNLGASPREEEEMMNPPRLPCAAGGGGGGGRSSTCAAAVLAKVSSPPLVAVAVVLLLLLPFLWASPAPASAFPMGGGCNGSIAECWAEEEFEMDSEIHRRMLQQERRYITYPPVRAGDRPVCDAGRGNSYTDNCLPPRSNNPTRPCNTYYHCRSGTTIPPPN